MKTSAEPPILPYPLALVGISLLSWPIFFSGQWDTFALVGFGFLLGLMALLFFLRSYPIIWPKTLVLVGLFFGWLVIVVATSQSALNAAWDSYAWWFFGITVFLFSMWLIHLQGLLSLTVRTLVVTQIVSSLIALVMVVKNPLQRATGLLHNANGFGGYALWGVIALFLLLILQKKPRWYWYTGFGIVVVAWLATVSVTAMVALLVTCLVGLIVSRTWWNKKRVMWLSVIVVLMVGAGVTAFQFPRVRALMDAAHLRSSFSQRQEFARAAWQMGLSRPLTGWGVGTFQIVYPQYTRQVNEQPRYPHNLLLQLFAETGLIGAGLWLACLITIGLAGWRTWHQLAGDDKKFLSALWFGWLAFTIHSLIDFSWQFPAGQVLWWTSSGIFLGLSVKGGPAHVRLAQAREKILAAVLAILILGWSGRVALGLTAMRDAERAVNAGKPDQEITALNTAIQWHPDRDRIFRLVNALWIRHSDGDLQVADTLLAQTLKRNHEDYSLYFWHGIILRARQNKPAALEAFHQAYRRDPAFHLEHAIEYARALGEAGRIEEKKQVVAETLRRYESWQRFDRSPIVEQLEYLRQL